MDDSRLRRSMLFDFYGELLTEKQREYYDLHYNEDLSLAEIAEQSGISRQGVWDMIRRAEAAMEQIEEKTGLIKRMSERALIISRLEEKLSLLEEQTCGEAAELCASMRDELEELKM